MEDNLNENQSSINEENNVEEKTSTVENNTEDVKKEEVKTSQVATCNRKIVDYNASWFTMLLYLGYLVVIFFVQKNTFEHHADVLRSNQYAFYFLSLICGVAICFALHNILKIIGAYIFGYKLLYIRFCGLHLDFNEGHFKMYFRITFDDFLSASMRFTSKKEDINRNPIGVFLFGFIGDALFIGLCLILFFLKDEKDMIHYYALYTLLYGLVLTLYELLPIRQDEANDIYNVISTSNKENRIAYNVYYINVKREQEGKDPIVQTFDKYESFYKSQVLYFNYLNCLYSNELEEGFKYLKIMQEVKPYLPDNDKFLANSELIYLRYLVDDEKEADKIYLNQKGDEKSCCLHPNRLSNYRTAILVLAHVVKDKERVKVAVDNYKKLSRSLDTRDSRRVKEENKRFIEAYNIIRTKFPTYNLAENVNLD